MEKVKPKKHLGQHFLVDLSIAEKIAKAVTGHLGVKKILEIGPGMGVLTDFLIKEALGALFG
jgi:16S rRNA (adenine1518-N6/adenine1519-N6)-dimethyltransferase